MHSLFETTQTLFWAVFGLVDLESFELDGIKAFTRFWGMLMFGTYSVINIVVLLNLLIAMMNHSYQLISVSVATFNLSLSHGHDRANSFFLSSLPSSSKKGTRRHRVEVRQEQALDQLLRGGWHGPTPVQHHPHPEERVVHGSMAVSETVRAQQSGEEGAHEDDQSENSAANIPAFPTRNR